MALGKNNTGDNVVYVSIINGKFTIKSKTKEPGTIPRINKNGEEIYEYHYDYLDGVVKGIQIFEGNYGKEFILTLTDVGEVYKIKIPINTKYFSSIVEKLGSLRESVIYRFIPYYFEDKEKKDIKGKPRMVTGINIFSSPDFSKTDKIEKYLTVENKRIPKYPESGDESDVAIWKIEKTKCLINEINRLKEIFNTPVQNKEVNVPPVDIEIELFGGFVTGENSDETDDLPF